jgi:Flp pilus assembly pilin Flp
MHRRFRRGSTLIEYILIAAIGAAAVFSGASSLGYSVAESLEAVSDALVSL